MADDNSGTSKDGSLTIPKMPSKAQVFEIASYINSQVKNNLIGIAASYNLEFKNKTSDNLKDDLITFFKNNPEKFNDLTNSPSLQSKSQNLFTFNSNEPKTNSNVISSKLLKFAEEYISRQNVSYSGEKSANILDFLKKLKEIKKRFSLSDTQLLSVVPEMLKKKALIWFTAYSSDFTSIDEFESEILKAFLPVDFELELKQEIQNRKMSYYESMDEFIAKIIIVNRKLTIPFSETELVSIVKRNSCPKYLLPLMEDDIVELEDILEKARKIETAEARKKKYSPPERINQIDSVFNVSEPNFQHNSHQYQKQSFQKSYNERPQNSNQPSTSNSQNYGKKNNFSGQNQYKKKEISCHGCGAPGVIRPKCPKCRPQNNSRNSKN